MDYRSIFNKKIDDKKILDQEEDLVAYGSDASLLEGLPSVVILVYNEQDFRNAVNICVENNFKFLVRGKATGYTGGCVPQENCVVISNENWKGIISFDEVAETAVFAPGTTITEVNEFGDKYNLFFPPDPISKDHCSLGGAISENSSGPRCLRFGPLHCFIEEFQFFTADGKEHIIKKENQDGISDYFYTIIGSEGTLGAVGWIKVRLVKKPTETLLFCMTFDTSEIINELLSDCFKTGIPFSAMEMITPSYHTTKGRVGRYYLLLEYFSYSERDKKMFFDKLNKYSKDLPVEITTPVGSIYEVRGKAYQTNRQLLKDEIEKKPISLLVDGVVPRTSLQNLVEDIFDIAEQNNIPMLDTFHFSDGNVHPTFFFENNKQGDKEKHIVLGLMMEKCLKNNGSLAAEHGIGLEKIDYIIKKHTNDEIKEFYRLKNKFDKNNMINPGKVLPKEMPHNDLVNNKFDTTDKISIDKINMNVVVEADVKIEELIKSCNEQNLNIGYLTINKVKGKKIIDVIRSNYKNLLSKRHGELKDSILGITFNDNGKEVVFGDKLVKNVSGYNICRSNEVLNKDIEKIALRVFNNNDNKYYKMPITSIKEEILLAVNSVSYDFTPLIINNNGEKYIIFSSIYNEEELEKRDILNVEILEDMDLFTELNIKSKTKCTLEKIDELKNSYIFDYQKGDVYEYEY